MIPAEKQTHRTMELTESPEKNSHIYDPQIVDKETKDTHWGKDGPFNKLCWGNCKITC